MTDKRIEEEYESWAGHPYSAEEIAFAFTPCEKNERKASFYAGFRAAERLTKLEVLSDLLVIIEKLDEYPVDEHTVGKNDGYSRVIDIINELLSSIKE